MGANLKVCVLGAGSSGNSTLIECGGTSILIDAGFGGREMLSRLRAVGSDYSCIDAIFVTHEHGDHVRGIRMLTQGGMPCRVYARESVIPLLPSLGAAAVETLHLGADVTVGSLTVTPFRVPHDAAQPVGYRIVGGGAVAVVVADCGSITAEMLPYYEGADFIMIESNHDEALLAASARPESLKGRIGSDYGHMSNRQVAEFLSDKFDGQARVVALGHLSSENNLPELARKSAQYALRKVGLEGLTELVVVGQDEPTEVFEFNGR